MQPKQEKKIKKKSSGFPVELFKTILKMMKWELREPPAMQWRGSRSEKGSSTKKATVKVICKESSMEQCLVYMCHCGNLQVILASSPLKQRGKKPTDMQGIMSRNSLQESLYINCRICVCYPRSPVFLSIMLVNTYLALAFCAPKIHFLYTF